MGVFFRVALIVGLGFVVAGGLYDQRHALACSLLDYSRFQPIGTRLYFDPSTSEEHRARLLDTLNAAKRRNENIFGALVAEPTILITDSPRAASTYGANEFGTTLKSALGQCIIIGPRGQNTDVMAHELMHAEVAHRAGLLATVLRMPIWFDEGVALMVDYRERYDPDLIDLPDGAVDHVKSLTSYDQFYGNARTIENYQAARLAVGELFDRMDTFDFYEKLEQVRGGESFDIVFGFED